MNGEGKSEIGGTSAAVSKEEEEEEVCQRLVYMWGYLPGASPQRSPLMSPVEVKIPPTVGSPWKDVSGGGCGFTMATAESGKLITWGSTDDLGQSYVTSGKHGLEKIVVENIVAFDEVFWIRLAARSDTCTSDDDKKDYEELATSVMTIVDCVVNKTQEIIQREKEGQLDEGFLSEVSVPADQDPFQTFDTDSCKGRRGSDHGSASKASGLPMDLMKLFSFKSSVVRYGLKL